MKNVVVKIFVVVLTFIMGVTLENIRASYKNNLGTSNTITNTKRVLKDEKTTFNINQAKEDINKKELSISIAVPKDGDNRNIIYSSTSDHFSVVITNVSNQPQKVWKEWCSWGYFSLWFEVEEEDGSKYEVHKKVRGWDRNYPDFCTIAPGENLVIDVYFGSDEWDNFPLPKDGNPKKVKLKAVFENGHDDVTDKDFLKTFCRCEDIWLGKIYSPTSEYFIYNYKR